jgi:hypothetical protein
MARALPPRRRPDSLFPKRTGWPLPVVAAAGLAVGIGLVVLIVAAVRSRSPAAGTSATGTSVEGTSPSTIPTPSAAIPAPIAGRPPAPAVVPAGVACSVAGGSRVLAPSATVAAGIEVRAFGDDVAVGFASSDHEALLVRLNPSTLAVSDATLIPSAEPVRRATPIPGKKGHLGLAVDVDRKNDSLQGRRTLPLDPPLQAGAAGGQLAWAPSGHRAAGKLWPLEGEGHVEAVRGARSETDLSGVALAFRQGGAVWVGTAELKDALTPRGNLSRLETLGPNVGSPAIAFNDEVVFVAWADRASSDQPWQLRWVRFAAGEAPPAPQTFAVPAGGTGEQAMSPGLAAVPGGGFLFVWTEGPASGHEVRAVTLAADGAQVGPPMRISTEGVNAGQGQAAIASGGHGVVVFLESAGSGFQVVASPILCER